MIWLGVIIGIVIMQIATLCVAYLTNENEDILIPFSVFIFYPIILLLQKAIQWFRKKKRRK